MHGILEMLWKSGPDQDLDLISSHGPILHSGILSLQLLYLLHRNVKIIKGDNRFKSTSKTVYSYRESYYLTVENMLYSS